MTPLLPQLGLLLVAFVALYLGAEWVVRGGARLAASFGVSPIVVGLTIVSMGTSAPELVVGVTAAARASGDLAVGNVLGSNLVNVGLILGGAALVRPLAVHRRVVGREVPIMLAVTVFLYPLIWDLELGRLEGVILLVVLATYLVSSVRTAAREEDFVRAERALLERRKLVRHGGARRNGALVVIGLAVLLAGAHAAVEAATFMARDLGISELVIGLTIVAVGTSLPELATSLVAAFRRQADIAVGNVIGSNIFNLAGILGLSALVHPIGIAASIPRAELPAVLAISLLVLPLARTGLRVERWEGMVLVGAYIGLGALIL